MTIELELDPVCERTVDATESREHGLAIELEGREYVFCGAQCRAAFGRKPTAYAVAGRTAP